MHKLQAAVLWRNGLKGNTSIGLPGAAVHREAAAVGLQRRFACWTAVEDTLSGSANCRSTTESTQNGHFQECMRTLCRWTVGTASVHQDHCCGQTLAVALLTKSPDLRSRLASSTTMRFSTTRVYWHINCEDAP